MASAFSIPSSSSSFVPSRGWTYDVFLSFRGVDTRSGFLSHLYTALNQRGIRVFKDDIDLHKGITISPQLQKAIEESRFVVIVFSKNYANSSWCLGELAMIIESQQQMGQTVLPVFYHVDPSDVRGQKSEFATAFKRHEEKFRGETVKVNKWRKALSVTANLSGWHISTNSHEALIIDAIVQKILVDLQPHDWEEDLIGIKSRIDKLNSLLNTEATKEVRIVGIYGMAGIGKTTIALALFGRISIEFEGSCFVQNIGDCRRTHDICAIQKKILQNTLKTAHEFNFDYPAQGADMIQKRLCNKKILLVLDDVDHVEKLEFLARRHEWFGKGSRIIITTRNERLLSCADEKYKPAFLLEDEAVKLFSRHAFRKDIPPEKYKELSIRAVNHAGCLPLALKLFGSSLHGRETNEWEDMLNRQAEAPNDEIYMTLKFSFNALTEHEKKIFLDIACLFIGRKVKDVIRIHDCFGYFPSIGIKVLIEKSLITISKGLLEMHALLREMGRKIVRDSNPNGRLRRIEEIHDFITEKAKLETLEAIAAERELYTEKLYKEKLGFNAKIFKSMKNLQLLDIENKFTSSRPTFLPTELRWLGWCFYPFSSLPVSHLRKLVGLKLEWGNIQHLWKGQMTMRKLKFIQLHEMKFLTRFPDVSEAPNIETLILTSCKNLVKVHESFGFLKKIKHLDMSYCSSIKCLPSRIEMESLETLILSGCESLVRFPEVSPCMDKLAHIDLHQCVKIEALPSSIEYLSALSFLNLSSCKSLKIIPNSICELKCLRSICLDYCWRLQNFPEEFGRIENLKELQLGSVKDYNPFERLAESKNLHTLTNLCSLRKLDLNQRQIRDEDFPKNLHGFSSLEELHLSGNLKLIQLPTGISHLSRLKKLMLNNCSNLQILHGLPSGIQVLEAINCRSLEKIKNLLKEHELLNKISLYGCQKLLGDEENERYLEKMLQESFIKKCAAANRCLSITLPGCKIPSWVNEQHGGEIALALPPELQTGIMGFVVCGVLGQLEYRKPPCIIFISEYDGMVKYSGGSSEPAEEKGNVYIGYVPFSLFQQQTDEDDDYGVQSEEDWSHIIQGNFLVRLKFNDYICCSGVHVVYKEDFEFDIDIKPSSFYWGWKPVFSSWIWMPAGWSKGMAVSFKEGGSAGGSHGGIRGGSHGVGGSHGGGDNDDGGDGNGCMGWCRWWWQQWWWLQRWL